MVRLKAGSKRTTFTGRPISIPHGSIKRGGKLLKGYFLLFGFQFHMVRLKASLTLKKSSDLKTFQFHMVRLKVLRCHNCRRIARFQFHMVRLKGRKGIVALSEVMHISIPHGSIKRSPAMPGSPAMPISIPHGSIKSYRILLTYDAARHFNSTWFD